MPYGTAKTNEKRPDPTRPPANRCGLFSSLAMGDGSGQPARRYLGRGRRGPTTPIQSVLAMHGALGSVCSRTAPEIFQPARAARD